MSKPPANQPLNKKMLDLVALTSELGRNTFPPAPDLVPLLKRRGAAEIAIERLRDEIASFEATLSSDEEIGGIIVGAPDGTAFHIRRFYALDMDIVVFEGLNFNGRSQRLVQHVSQLNILLTALPKLHETPIRIGFAPSEADQTTPPA